MVDLIQPHHRFVAVGMTGTGKSQVLLSIFAEDPGPRLLIDVNDAYYMGETALADPGGLQETDDPAAIDWTARTIRVVPPSAGKAARPWFDDLYAAIWARSEYNEQLGGLLVVLDESVGPTDANYAPPMLELVITQGRKRRIRHGAAMQRPANVYPGLLAQSEHAFVFDVGSRRDDLDRIGERFGWNGAEVGDALRELADEYGYEDADGFHCHGYLRHRLGRREVHRFPPLPPEVIAHANAHVVNAT